MAIRVSSTEVKAILEDISVGEDITPFIAVANILVEQKLVPLDLLEESQLKEIERWLSAHFVSIKLMRAARESAGSAAGRVGIDYQYKVGFDLRNTMYGQAAITLDTTGTLKAMTDEKGDGGSSFTSINPDLWS